ncbi:MAG TPA: hypothetical protein VGA80_11935 [Flavobacteriaceae bacterium]|jgi:hypothetical protein
MEEIYMFSNLENREQVEIELANLLKKKTIYKIDEFYLPINQPDWVKRRINGNRNALRKMKKAKKMAKVLSLFPFVQSVMISGTLSKGYMDKTSDIDFFVITKPGNIVISKFLIGCFRRVFARKSFCVNFLLDWNNLYIKKQNIYSAIEIATLIPVVDSGLYEKFISKNESWVLNFLPNIAFKKNDTFSIKDSFIKRNIENLFSTIFFLKLGNSMLSFYLNKLGKGNEIHCESLKTNELQINNGVFKGHNLNYEKRILTLFERYQKDILRNNRLILRNYFYD